MKVKEARKKLDLVCACDAAAVTVLSHSLASVSASVCVSSERLQCSRELVLPRVRECLCEREEQSGLKHREKRADEESERITESVMQEAKKEGKHTLPLESRSSNGSTDAHQKQTHLHTNCRMKMLLLLLIMLSSPSAPSAAYSATFSTFVSQFLPHYQDV